MSDNPPNVTSPRHTDFEVWLLHEQRVKAWRHSYSHGVQRVCRDGSIENISIEVPHSYAAEEFYEHLVRNNSPRIRVRELPLSVCVAKPGELPRVFRVGVHASYCPDLTGGEIRRLGGQDA